MIGCTIDRDQEATIGTSGSREDSFYDAIFPGASHSIPVATLCRCGGLFTQHNRSHTSAPVTVTVGECELSMHVEHNYNGTESGNWRGGYWLDRHMYVTSGQRSYECDFNVF